MTCRYEKSTKIDYNQFFFNALLLPRVSQNHLKKATTTTTTPVQSVETFREHFFYNQYFFLALSDVMLGLDFETGVSKGSDVPRRTIGGATQM